MLFGQLKSSPLLAKVVITGNITRPGSQPRSTPRRSQICAHSRGDPCGQRSVHSCLTVAVGDGQEYLTERTRMK